MLSVGPAQHPPGEQDWLDGLQQGQRPPAHLQARAGGGGPRAQRVPPVGLPGGLLRHGLGLCQGERVDEEKISELWIQIRIHFPSGFRREKLNNTTVKFNEFGNNKKKIKRYSVGFALLCRIRNKTKFRFQILPTPRKVSVAFSNNFPSRLKKNLILCYHFNNLQMFSNLNSSYYYREGKKCPADPNSVLFGVRTYISGSNKFLIRDRFRLHHNFSKKI